MFRDVAMLDAQGRIQLSRSCMAWCEQVQAQPAVRIVPLMPAISIDSTRLPGSFHSNPADRMIVATARAESAVLLSNHQMILDYVAAGAVSAVAPLAR